MKKRILIVGDDHRLLEAACRELENRSELVAITASSVRAGIELALQLRPDLIVLDVALPVRAMESVCRRFHKDWETREIPRLLLLDSSTLGASPEAVTQELGADDYVLKPLDPAQLIARVTAMLRRRLRDAPGSKIFSDGRLYIDFDAFLLRVDGREVKLTLKEFSLLKYLVQHQDQVFSRDKLFDVVWQNHRLGSTRTVDVHVRRIRMKLGLEDYIETIVGVGYHFKRPKAAKATPPSVHPSFPLPVPVE